MRHIPTLVRREMGAYFLSPIAYLLLFAFQVIAWINFREMMRVLADPMTSYTGMADPLNTYISGSGPFWFAILFAVPALTMRLLAEERRSGTIESLLTVPVTEVEVVVSKWLAGVIMFWALLLPFAIYLPFLRHYGQFPFDLGPVATLAIGLTTMGMMFVAIGVFFSALTKNQIIAAFFLVLTWVLRGTPLGQAIEDEPEGEGRPDPRGRDRAVIMAVSGMLLVAIGAYVAVAFGVPWSIPVFALGYGLVGYTIKTYRTYRHASPTLRRVVSVSDSAMTASLFAGVLIVANVLAFRYGERPIDFTSDKVYSLSSLTLKQIKELDRPLKFTVFMGNTPRAQRQLGRVLQLLDLYKEENPGKITIDSIQPLSEQVRFDELAQRVPEVAVAMTGGIVVEYGQDDSIQHTVVRNGELFESTGDAFETDRSRVQTTFNGEDAITSALIRLAQEKKPKVAFITGHGELSVHEMDPNKNGLGVLRERLRGQGAEIVVVNLAREPVPPDAVVAVLAAPSTEFSPEEANRLDRYMRENGRLLFCVGAQTPDSLRAWLKRDFHVELGSQPVLDPKYNLRGQWNSIGAPIVGDSHHPIVEPLLNRRAAMPASTALAVTDSTAGAAGAAAESPFRTEVILHSSQESWVESEAPDKTPPQFDPQTDKRGPVPLGVAIYELPKDSKHRATEEEVGRVVIFSSPLIASNPYLVREFANLDVVVNAFNWLRGKPQLTGISPKTHTALRLAVNPALQSRLVSIPTLLSIVAIFGLGAATYYNRRA